MPTDIIKLALAALSANPEIEKKLVFRQETALRRLFQNPKVEIELNRATAEREVLKNKRLKEAIKILRQAYRIRWILFLSLLGLMFAETVLLVVFVYFYSRAPSSNPIDNTTLQIIVGATILQISVMVAVIVKSAFPADMKPLIDVS